MQCKNCGANYKTRELMCPYCSTENIIGKIWKAKRTEAELEYERERKALGKKYSVYVIDRVLNRAIIISILLFILLIVGVFVVSFVQETYRGYRNEAKQDEIIDKLEEFYEAGRFGEMDDYLYEEGIEGDAYYPYLQITSINYRYESYLNCKYTFLDMTYEEQMEDDYYLEYAIKNSIDVYTMEFGVFSELDPRNEEVYASYKKEIESFWKCIVGFTDEDIAYITDEENRFLSSADIDRFVTKAKERLGEDNE